MVNLPLRRAAGVGVTAVVAALALLLTPASPAEAAKRPIVYAVVIDGLDGDAVDAGEAPFISSLINGGANTTYYEESRAVMVTETNPNHTAMMTGRYTRNSGIPGNSFAIYAPLEGEEDNEADTCVRSGPRDPRSLPTETSGEDASCVAGETVFEAIKRQGNPDKLTTAAVMGKAKLGRIFSGEDAKGNRWVDHLWAPCTPNDGPEEQEYCGDVPIEPINQDRTINDTDVMDEVIRTMDEGVGPRDERPDFTFVNLPNVDNAGHVLGGGSAAYNTAIGLADIEIERLVTRLQERGEWDRTVLVILSDHAHDATSQVTNLTGEIEDAGVPSDEFMVIDNGNADMVYLADRKSPDRFELLKTMREAILAAPGVTEALYRRPNPADGGERFTITNDQPDWYAAGGRTGDILATAEPGRRFSDPSMTSNPLPGNHGGWHTRDNTFLVASGGDIVADANVAGAVDPQFSDTLQNPNQAENVDLAATVLGAFGLLDPRGSDGRYLDESLIESSLPGAAKPAFEPVVRARKYSTRGKLDRFFVSWGATGDRKAPPDGGRWTLQVRSGRGNWRTLVDQRERQGARVKVPARGSHKVRVRALTAAGIPTDWSAKKLR
jgi:hypothetical protein